MKYQAKVRKLNKTSLGIKIPCNQDVQAGDIVEVEVKVIKRYIPYEEIKDEQKTEQTGNSNNEAEPNQQN